MYISLTPSTCQWTGRDIPLNVKTDIEDHVYRNLSPSPHPELEQYTICCQWPRFCLGPLRPKSISIRDTAQCTCVVYMYVCNSTVVGPKHTASSAILAVGFLPKWLKHWVDMDGKYSYGFNSFNLISLSVNCSLIIQDLGTNSSCLWRLVVEGIHRHFKGYGGLPFWVRKDIFY